MSASINNLKAKIDTLLRTIADGLSSKLGKNENAVTASKLAAPFSLSLTNDALGTASIDGSGNVNLEVTLKQILAQGGIFTKVEVDTTGRIIGVSFLTENDIPDLSASKINAGVFHADRIPQLDASKVVSGVFDLQRIPLPQRLDSNRTISITGDASWSVQGDFGSNLSAALTLADTGVSAGTYGAATQIPSFTVDSKGRITGVTLVDIRAQTSIPVNEYVTLTSGNIVQYDLQTLLGTDYENFDLKTAEICVRAKDTNVASPMYNAYTNAEAMVTYGIKDERYVIVANQSNEDLELYVKVLVHPL